MADPYDVLGNLQPPSGYEGYAALGDLLAGGATRRAEANAPAYLGAASDAAYKFNRAAAERTQAVIAAAQQHSREGLPAAISGVYANPNEAALAAAVLGSAPTPNMRNLGDFQTPGHAALVQAQQDALAQGDYKRMNATTAVLGDKQFEPVLARGGAYIENGATLGDLDAVPTPEAAERINAIQAHTRQGQQRTDAAVRRADRPPTPRASHGPSHSAAADEAAILEQARQRVAAGHKPAEVAAYLRSKGYPSVAKKIYQGP